MPRTAGVLVHLTNFSMRQLFPSWANRGIIPQAIQKEFDLIQRETHIAGETDEKHTIERFGGLSLGESTHLVDWVGRFRDGANPRADVYLLTEDGSLSLPVWVDHVGSAGTRYVSGEIVPVAPVRAPSVDRIATFLQAM